MTKQKLIKPQALQHGDLIRVVASASPFDKKAFETGVELLKTWGFRVKYQSNIFNKTPYLAGTDQRRAKEILNALNDDKCKAILFARGGYGSMRLIPYLEQAKIKSLPKIILGYSDITTLLIYFQKRLGWTNFYGPVVAKDLSPQTSLSTLTSLKMALFGFYKGESYFGKKSQVIIKGTSKGPLVGGCLTLVASLLGTKYQLDTRGKILFLEDVNEKPYQIDRMLNQLKLSGLFDKCNGILFGSLDGPNPQKHYVETIKSVVSGYKFPVMIGFPAGHGKEKMSLPLGIKTELNTRNKSVTFLESAHK